MWIKPQPPDSQPASRPTEVALVCAARTGDNEALQALLGQNWTWLKGFVFNLLGNADDVDEVLQEICVVAIRKINTVREPERFKAWLATVARHAALAYRQQRARRPLSLDETVAQQQQDHRHPDQVEALVREEQRDALMQAIEALPEKYREVFILKHLQDASYAEIAEALDIAVTTVQIRLVRARRMVYNHLTGRPNEKVPRT